MGELKKHFQSWLVIPDDNPSVKETVSQTVYPSHSMHDRVPSPPGTPESSASDLPTCAHPSLRSPKPPASPPSLETSSSVVPKALATSSPNLSSHQVDDICLSRNVAMIQNY